MLKVPFPLTKPPFPELSLWMVKKITKSKIESTNSTQKISLSITQKDLKTETFSHIPNNCPKNNSLNTLFLNSMSYYGVIIDLLMENLNYMMQQCLIYIITI